MDGGGFSSCCSRFVLGVLSMRRLLDIKPDGLQNSDLPAKMNKKVKEKNKLNSAKNVLKINRMRKTYVLNCMESRFRWIPLKLKCSEHHWVKMKLETKERQSKPTCSRPYSTIKKQFNMNNMKFKCQPETYLKIYDVLIHCCYCHWNLPCR